MRKLLNIYNNYPESTSSLRGMISFRHCEQISVRRMGSELGGLSTNKSGSPGSVILTVSEAATPQDFNIESESGSDK